MVKHTKEPWKVGEGGGSGATSAAYMLNENGKQKTIVANCWHEHVNRPFEEVRANAERIVACVNACAGIPDPSDLRTQRDELLVMLREVTTDWRTRQSDNFLHRADALIARIEGEEK